MNHACKVSAGANFLLEKHENASTDYDSGIGNVVLIVEISVGARSARVKVGERTRDLCWNIIVVSRRRENVTVVQKFETSSEVDDRDVKGYLVTYSLCD